MSSINENSFQSLLDAMNYGLPTFAFDSAFAPANLLSDGSGVLIDERNKNKYADKILEMLNDEKLLKSYSEKSLNKVKEYTDTRVKYTWINLLNELSAS